MNGYNSISLRSLNEGYNLSEASDIKLGSNTINAIYYGSTLLWPLVTRDYSNEYLTIEALPSNNVNIYFRYYYNDMNIPIQYSRDMSNWTTIYFGSADKPKIITLSAGDKIYLKGNNQAYGDIVRYCNINFLNGKVYMYGNIMSLVYGDNFYGQTLLTTDYTFKYLFSTYDYKKPSLIVDASNLVLPATTLSYGCYSSMFYECKYLTAAPELPATTLEEYCYSSMFCECNYLTAAPELPATTLTKGCYSSMFSSCGLTAAPELPATTLAQRCYELMFSGCASLNYIKCLATNISATDCLFGWVDAVASTGTFVKNKNMPYWTTGTSGIPSGWTVQDA